MSMNKDWICIHKTTALFEAEALKGYLLANDIPAVIVNKRSSSYNDFGLVEVHVPNRTKQMADEILKNHLKN